jgi:DNA-binding winged helix-turn-helix (wHTH) protein/tetratricopeptide (TPR) repeat protein
MSSKGLSKSSQRNVIQFSAPAVERFRFGPFFLDRPNRMLLRDDEPVPLTPKAFETLLALVERASQVVTKDELLNLVWPDTFVEEATLTQNIYTLRKALGDDGDGAMIETIPRRGYRFVAAVQTAKIAAAALPSVTPIAVLPFRTLGYHDHSELLALGMADALITRLSNLRRLAVRPTSAVMTFLGTTEDSLSLGRRLGVEAILEGTIQFAGTRLRATVQLISVEDGTFLWAEKFDSVFSDIFTVQDAISQQVAETFQLRLTQREERGLRQSPTGDAESYEAYLQGRYHWNKRSRDSLRRAIACFQRAADLDPTSARAFAGLADSYVLLPLYGDAAPMEVFPMAREAASRALGLNGELAEAHTSLAYTRFIHDWQWHEAEAGFLKALALNDHYATAHQWYGFFLAAQGRFQEALVHARRAQQLDPLSLPIGADLGFVLYFSRQFDRAIERFRHTLELDPEFAYGHFGLALAVLAQAEAAQDGSAQDGGAQDGSAQDGSAQDGSAQDGGAQTGIDPERVEIAVAAARRAVELSGRRTAMLAALGFALARAGREEEAEGVAQELRTLAQNQFVPASRLAMVYTGLGREEAALEQLAKAARERSRFMAFLGVWPVFDSLRGRPAFRQLLAEIGLPKNLR